MTDDSTFGLKTGPSQADRDAEFGLKAPADVPPASGAFFGAASLLPESVQNILPGFVKGPSVGEQLTSERERTLSEEARLGRPLTLSERLKTNRATDSPVAMGFATRQIGELPGVMSSSSKGRSDKFITDQYTRAVKPSTSGKTSASDVVRYKEQTRSAISSIIDNKSNLRYVDDAGNVRQGELPKTLEEFSDAVEQTKQGIFDKYNALAKQTQAAGIDVSLSPTAAELSKIAYDPVVNLMHPELSKYAFDRSQSFSGASQLSASDAQRAVTMLNQTLKAFYRNPTYETAARANVDAMIANKLRGALDEAVETAVGPGYQELKNQYGSLAEIEKDVNKRAQVYSRQEKGGGLLGRFGDVASAEEVVRGLITLNPKAVLSGLTLKGVIEGIRHIRSPNRAVTRLFGEAEDQRTPQPQDPIIPSWPISPILPIQGQDPRRSLLGQAR